ncbi:unnamed protein product [Laminaria digitata]
MTRNASVGALPLLLLLLPLLCTAFVQTSFRLHGRGLVVSNEAGIGNKFPFRSRRHATRAGEGTTMGLFSLFSSGTKAAKKTDTAAAAQLSLELFNILTAEGAKPDDAVVMEKIEQLEAVPGVTFNKDYLYDGPWRVLWKTNTAWQKYFDPLNNVADNRAYQWYKEDGSVTNIAQAVGDKLYVTVDGQGTPASMSTELPYEVNVEVSRAWLHALGGKIPLDFIKGKGTTFVVYNDARLRVFRSDTGGVVVQTKAEEVVAA